MTLYTTVHHFVYSTQVLCTASVHQTSGIVHKYCVLYTNLRVLIRFIPYCRGLHPGTAILFPECIIQCTKVCSHTTVWFQLWQPDLPLILSSPPTLLAYGKLRLEPLWASSSERTTASGLTGLWRPAEPPSRLRIWLIVYWLCTGCILIVAGLSWCWVLSVQISTHWRRTCC